MRSTFVKFLLNVCQGHKSWSKSSEATLGSTPPLDIGVYQLLPKTKSPELIDDVTIR